MLIHHDMSIADLARHADISYDAAWLLHTMLCDEYDGLDTRDIDPKDWARLVTAAIDDGSWHSGIFEEMEAQGL